MSSEFPIVTWGRSQATYVPFGAPLPAGSPRTAVLVFAWHEGRCVLADIAGRGWCIPSGRIEPGETPEQTARREAQEEAGLTLGPLTCIGHTLLTHTETGHTETVPAFAAPVLRFDPLPEGFESGGIRLVDRSELPDCYFLWDPLIAAVFDHAFERMKAETFSPPRSPSRKK